MTVSQPKGPEFDTREIVSNLGAFIGSYIWRKYCCGLNLVYIKIASSLDFQPRDRKYGGTLLIILSMKSPAKFKDQVMR